MSKILCIYPDDQSTKFLNRIQYYLKTRFKDDFHCFKIKPYQESHDECLKRVYEDKTEELIIFLGHGRSDCLVGSRSRQYGASLSNGYMDQNPDATFFLDKFVDINNIHFFANKKMFCLSCNSADRLGKIAINKGVKSFIGFGFIPTDNEIFEEQNKSLPYLTARYKGEISWIIKTSLALAIVHNYCFYQLIDTIKLLTNFSINEVILKHKQLRERRLLADYLFQFKEEMKLFGDGNRNIFDCK